MHTLRCHDISVLIYCLQINHVQVLLQSRSVLASEFIFPLTQSWPWYISPNSCNSGLQMHHQTHSIIGSKCISKLLYSASKCISKLAPTCPPSAFLSSTWSRPASASPTSFNHGLQVHLWVTWSPPPYPSRNSLNYGLQVHLLVQLGLGLQVHLQPRTITASGIAHWWSPSASPN